MDISYKASKEGKAKEMDWIRKKSYNVNFSRWMSWRVSWTKQRRSLARELQHGRKGLLESGYPALPRNMNSLVTGLQSRGQFFTPSSFICPNGPSLQGHLPSDIYQHDLRIRGCLHQVVGLRDGRLWTDAKGSYRQCAGNNGLRLLLKLKSTTDAIIFVWR